MTNTIPFRLISIFFRRFQPFCEQNCRPKLKKQESGSLFDSRFPAYPVSALAHRSFFVPLGVKPCGFWVFRTDIFSVHNVGCGGWIRTTDLWVMSPTSCHCSTPRYLLSLECFNSIHHLRGNVKCFFEKTRSSGAGTCRTWPPGRKRGERRRKSSRRRHVIPPAGDTG